MIFDKTCIVCGNSFTSRGTRAYYCRDCKEKAYREMEERKQARYIETRRERAHINKIKKGASKAPQLHEINQKAKDSGMTYGEYQAKLYQEKYHTPQYLRKGKR